ncbi:MAG: Ig-like domain-containing protein [Steroidobacteraceae bacterium]
MILPGGLRFARAFFGGCKPLVALHLLCVMALMSACHSSSASYSPPPVQLTSIAVGPPDSSVAMGLSSQFTATGLYSDGSKKGLSSQVTWSSANAAAAWISSAGVATAAGPGSTMITAKMGKMTGSTNLNVTAATLVVIDLTPTNASVPSGLGTRFVAAGVYTDNSVHDISAAVTWTSSVNSVTSISNTPGSNGTASSAAPGSTMISATLGALSASTPLTVTSATLVSIEVMPTNPSIANGLSDALQATGIYTDHSTHDLTSSVTWSSSVASVASVSNLPGSNGLATSASPGSTTINAAFGGISGSTNLTVTTATLVSLGVTPANPSIAKGLKSQFTAVGSYTDSSTKNLTAQVQWSSSDPTLATVSNAAGYDGLATGLNPGSVTITATLAGTSASSVLTVTPATLVSIGVTSANPSIANGLTSQFTATGVYSDNSTQDLTASVAWTSADTTVASVSNAPASHGLATGVSPGTVAITAASGSVSGTMDLTVTPAVLVSIALIPANPSIANGTRQQFAAAGTYTDASTHDVTAAVTWSSSDSTVVISNAAGSNGLATSVGQGAVSITATLGAIVGSTGLTVTPAALVSIAVIPANTSIANGTGQQFAATGTYTDNSTQPLTTAVSWSSSDTTVASISNASGSKGLASSAGQGTATIAATLDAVSGSTGLTVSAATLVSIAITPASPNITDGTTQLFTATGSYTDNSTQNLTASVTWSSSDTTIASVSNAPASNGLATAVGIGTTSIGATLGAVTASIATLTATAAPEYAYASNQTDNTVSQYTIGAGGALTFTGTQATGAEPNAIAVVPSGRYLYVANWIDNTLSEYTIASDGTLTAIGTVATGSNPASIIVDPTSSYVYVANLAGNTVSEYAVGAGGVLTNIGTIATGSGPACIAIDPSGLYVYSANQGSNDVSEFAIGAGGTLTSAGTVAAGGLPQSVAIDPTGRYAYVANYNDGTVSQYTIGSGGTLTAIGSIAAGSLPESLVIDPTGHYVYAADHGGNTVSEYQIGTGGALVAIGAIAAGSGPWYITVEASGRYVYVANFNDNTVSQYSLGTGGALTFIGTIATGSGPNAVDTGL